MAIYTIELDGKQYDIEGNRPPTEEEARSAIQEFGGSKTSRGVSGEWEAPVDSVANMGIKGYAEAHPFKAALQPIATTLTGKSITDRMADTVGASPYVENFDKSGGKVNNFANAMDIAGQTTAGVVGDIAEGFTSPAGLIGGVLSTIPKVAQGGQLLGQLIAKSGVGQTAGKVLNADIGKLFKYENSLKMATKAKEGLDASRNILGTGVRVAIKDVENLPTSLDVSQIPEKLTQSIKKSVYGIEFDENGGIVQRVGNLNKLKEANYDLITSKDFIEASNAEKAQLRRFAGKISGEMRRVAKQAGKPIDSALDAYGSFMDKYNVINSKLVDKYGTAQGNKLKTMFKMTAEPATKQAWKDISKVSPELKSVMGSMNRRELLKLLVKVAGVGVPGTGATIAGIKAIRGD